jgi:3-oxoacyl-[acyl-carrier-protein] synthase II
MTERRVVVTGVGLVSPVGIGTEETWNALLRGDSGIAPIRLFDTSRFPCSFAGEVKDFFPEKYIDRKDIKKMGRFIQFAMAATEFAMSQSVLRVTEENAERVGVYVGSGIGSIRCAPQSGKQTSRAG